MGRTGPMARFKHIFDEESCNVLPTPVVKEDPLRFRDSKKYTARIKAARSATGEHDALINAYGTIETATVVLGVQDFAFMGGSMGMGVGEIGRAAGRERGGKLVEIGVVAVTLKKKKREEK